MGGQLPEWDCTQPRDDNPAGGAGVCLNRLGFLAYLIFRLRFQRANPALDCLAEGGLRSPDRSRECERGGLRLEVGQHLIPCGACGGEPATLSARVDGRRSTADGSSRPLRPDN